MKTLELNCEITRHIYPTGGNQGIEETSSEIYPINNTTNQKMTGHLIHGGPTYLTSVGGDTTTIYALETRKNVEVWDPNDQKWAMAPTEYQMKTKRDFFGLLAVSRDLVC